MHLSPDQELLVPLRQTPLATSSAAEVWMRRGQMTADLGRGCSRRKKGKLRLHVVQKTGQRRRLGEDQNQVKERARRKLQWATLEKGVGERADQVVWQVLVKDKTRSEVKLD